MRAARLYGTRDVRVDDVDAPAAGPGEVLLDVAACGICGSDVHIYTHGAGAYSDSHLPFTMGHEATGTVVDAGNGVDVEVGSDVVINPLVACGECPRCAEANYNLCENLTVIGAQRPGAYAEQVVAPATNVVPIPEEIPTDLAAVSEPVAVAYHGLQRSPLRSGQSAAVVGLGPIGLGMVQLAKDAGADPVIASGHREARRDLANECGADVVVDPREEDPVEVARELTAGGVDVSFEVAGSESALSDAVKMAKPGGHTVLLGVFGGAVEFEPMDVVNKERTITAGAAYRTGPLADKDFGAVLRKAENGDVDLESLVTARIGIEDIVDDGFESLADGESGDVKVLVTP